MDMITTCKDKLTHFRIKELKDILTQLGLSKQGKKQDLVDRILAVLSNERVSGMWAKKDAVGKEEVAKLVFDTYRKMKVSGATDLASNAQSISDSNNVKFKEEIEDTFQVDKICCPCGNSLQTDSMIKCEDPKCHVWQHIGCVIIPEKPMECVQPFPPEIFYCELCRLRRADPFWVPVTYPLPSTRLTITDVTTDRGSPVQSVEKTFQLTRAHKDLLSKPEFDVQAWCMLLNDKVPFRMQWPQYADLHVNGVPVRAINRPGSQLLGANGRDDGPLITTCTRDGINKISLTGCDARVFCMGVRIVKRRTVQQILNLVPRESDGERFEDALARVCRCVGGGTTTENADSDSDLEVVADFIPVNLCCPMSGLRMKIAGRFKPCVHMGCFDLEVFVEMNQRSRKWQCPICLKNYSLENVIIDPYFNRITSVLRYFGEDVAEIEVKPDGSWRGKAEGDCKSLGDLGKWHLPDGTLIALANGEAKPKPDVDKQVKQEVVSEGYGSLRLGIRKNSNGFWEVSKHDVEVHTLSSDNRIHKNVVNHDQNVIPKSSSAIGNSRDGDDTNINQDCGGNFVFPTNNRIELDSVPLNIEPTCGILEHSASARVGENEVIVLSDSDDENVNHVSNQTNSVGVTFQVPHGIPHSYNEDPTLTTGGGSCLGLFNPNDEENVNLVSNQTNTVGVTFPVPRGISNSYNEDPSLTIGGGSCLSLFNPNDDENVNLVSNQTNTVGVTFSVPHGISNSYNEDPALTTGGGSCLGLFNPIDDDFMHMWSLSSGSQGGNGFQLFDSDPDVSDALVDPQLDCPTSINGYTLSVETPMESATFVSASSCNHSNANINNGLHDNPMVFGPDDPSLQLFLPTRPSDTSTQTDMREEPFGSNSIHTEDWTSLRLGHGGGGVHGETATGIALDLRDQVPSKEGALDSVTDTASLLLAMNDNRSVKTNRETSDSPFSFPRRRRSVRPRLYLSIDSDF